MIRRWMLIFLVFLALPVTCLAADRLGCIRLTMNYDGKPVTGGTVALYDVTACPEEMNPEELAAYVKEQDLPGEIRQIDKEGRVTFENLAHGVYLLTQKVPAEGYLPMKPFIVSLPISLNGQLIYEIDAFPKLQPKEKLPQTGQLIWPAWAFIGAGLAFIGIGLSNLKREQ